MLSLDALFVRRNACPGSSVGRAVDWKSACRWFKSAPGHHFFLTASFSPLPHKLMLIASAPNMWEFCQLLWHSCDRIRTGTFKKTNWMWSDLIYRELCEISYNRQKTGVPLDEIRPWFYKEAGQSSGTLFRKTPSQTVRREIANTSTGNASYVNLSPNVSKEIVISLLLSIGRSLHAPRKMKL